MYTGPIIDNHMHFWDLSNDYPWLNNRDPAIERLIGNYEALRHNFLVPDYFAMTLGWNVVKSVHIQAFGFPDDPVGETEWVQKQTDKYGYPHGIVAYADLTESNLEDTLQRHCMHPNVHGIRMPLNYDKEDWRRMAKNGDYMRDKRWRKGLSRCCPVTAWGSICRFMTTRSRMRSHWLAIFLKRRLSSSIWHGLSTCQLRDSIVGCSTWCLWPNARRTCF